MSVGSRLTLVTLVVPDYAQGLSFFVDGLGWTVLQDEPQGDKRWVTIAPPGGGCRLLLARAADAAQRARIGDQTGGRVAFFLETDSIDHDLARIEASGGHRLEEPRTEPYGKVVQWTDPFDNRWDLIEPTP